MNAIDAKVQNKLYMQRIVHIISLLGLLLLASCRNTYTPKPEGYYRIDIPEAAYERFAAEGYPYTFEMSKYAVVKPHQQAGEAYWIDIRYPQWQVDIHCSYKSMQNNLRDLAADAQEFVYKHAQMASGLPAQAFENKADRVYGVFYALEGETASPCQCFVTDSSQHFFRAAVYFNCAPNTDSLAPVRDFVQADLRHLMETFEWK